MWSNAKSAVRNKKRNCFKVLTSSERKTQETGYYFLIKIPPQKKITSICLKLVSIPELLDVCFWNCLLYEGEEPASGHKHCQVPPAYSQGGQVMKPLKISKETYTARPAHSTSFRHRRLFSTERTRKQYATINHFDGMTNYLYLKKSNWSFN